MTQHLREAYMRMIQLFNKHEKVFSARQASRVYEFAPIPRYTPGTRPSVPLYNWLVSCARFHWAEREGLSERWGERETQSRSSCHQLSRPVHDNPKQEPIFICIL